MKNCWIRSGAATAVVLMCAASHATQATFSLDGTKVYRVAKAGLECIDLEKRTVSKIAPPKLPAGEEIVSLGTSNSGYILCLSASQLQSYNAEKDKYVTVCKAPKGVEFLGAAYNPANGGIELEQYDKKDFSSAWLAKNNEKPVELNVRRATVEGASFESSGTLYFGSRGDLWKGQIEQDDEPGGAVSVTAKRVAALATLETYNGTSDSVGVRETSPAGDFLYMHMARMGGSGWGSMVRIKNPDHLPEQIPDYMRIYAQAATSLEVLGERARESYLCSSRDGRKVFFAMDSEPASAFYLIQDNGKPEKLDISGLEP